MDISLIIPAYNEEGYIGPCLEAVFRHAPGKFKEIIVVDNASTDGTAMEAVKHAGVRVVRAEQKGLTCARQAGFEASSGALLAYIDADCRITPQWFSKAEALIHKYPHAVSWSGPALYYYDAPSWLWNLQLSLGWWLTAPLVYRCFGYLLQGGNFIVRREALEKIGGFDPKVVFYGEDTTLARRLHEVGKTIYAMDFYVLTSARRFLLEGYFRTNMHYVMNYLWPVLYGKPYHHQYTDMRSTKI
jgi:glycosyltransferase involved in cell wall biosynthesis